MILSFVITLNTLGDNEPIDIQYLLDEDGNMVLDEDGQPIRLE